MPKKIVTLCTGGKFEYDDSIQELYRITEPDGTIKLKLEGCPEVHILNNTEQRKRTTVYDSYIIMTLDPNALSAGIGKIIKGLRVQFPYFDAYIRPAILPFSSNYFNELLVQDGGFFLFLVGDSPRVDRDVKYYLANMIGSLTATDINGHLCNETVECDDIHYPLAYSLSCITTGQRIPNRTGGASYHRDMAIKTAKAEKLKFKK